MVPEVKAVAVVAEEPEKEASFVLTVTDPVVAVAVAVA